MIRSVATGRLWDISSDEVEDGTPVILWPEKEQSLVEGGSSGLWHSSKLRELMSLIRLEKSGSE